MAKATFDVGSAGRVTVELQYITSDAQLAAALPWLQAQSELGLDYETGGDGPKDGLNPRKGKIATMQLGNPLVADPRAYVIDVRCVSLEALRPIFDILEDPAVLILGQNLKFECKWTLSKYGVWIRNMYDSMLTELQIRAGILAIAAGRNKAKKGTDQTVLAIKDKQLKGKDKVGGVGGERAVYQPVAMGKMMQRYFGVDIEKDFWLRTSFYKTPAGKHDWRQQMYAAGDVVYPFYLRARQAPIIAERGVGQVLRVEHELLPIIAHAELEGVQIDIPAWFALSDTAEAEYARCQAELDKLVAFLSPTRDLFDDARPTNPWSGSKKTGPLPWNWDSPAQVRDAILAYCKEIQWPYEIVHSERRIQELKVKFGTAWLESRNQRERREAERNGRKAKLLTTAMIPEWLIPDRFVLLPDVDGKRLLVHHTRNLLPRELIKPLMELSKASQRISNYGRGMVAKHVDGFDAKLEQMAEGTAPMMRYEIHQLAAATGRFSMQPNLQSIPRDAAYRACFVPREGYSFCIADLSQIEPRLLAQVSGDPVYTETYKAGKDLYVSVGERMYGQTIDKKTPEGAALRQRAKVSVLALAYMMGPAKYRNEFTRSLSDDIIGQRASDISLDDATDQREMFFQACTGIRPYQEDCVAQTNWDNPNSNRLYDDMLDEMVTYIKAPCGRIRLWAREQNAFAEPVNHPIQGGSATGMKLAMVLLQRMIHKRKWDARMVISVHDELIVEARTDIAPIVAAALKHCMEQAFKGFCPDIPIVAEFPEASDAGVCPRWLK